MMRMPERRRSGKLLFYRAVDHYFDAIGAGIMLRSGVFCNLPTEAGSLGIERWLLLSDDMVLVI